VDSSSDQLLKDVRLPIRSEAFGKLIVGPSCSSSLRKQETSIGIKSGVTEYAPAERTVNFCKCYRNPIYSGPSGQDRREFEVVREEFPVSSRKTSSRAAMH